MLRGTRGGSAHTAGGKIGYCPATRIRHTPPPLLPAAGMFKEEKEETVCGHYSSNAVRATASLEAARVGKSRRKTCVVRGVFSLYSGCILSLRPSVAAWPFAQWQWFRYSCACPASARAGRSLRCAGCSGEGVVGAAAAARSAEWAPQPRNTKMSLSKFLGASVPYNCYEIGHTWTPHCSQAWIDVWYNTFTRALRLYGLLYLVGQLLARRHGPRAFMQTFWSAFDSSMFLSQNFFIYLALVCMLRRLTGRLHLMQSTLLCGFVSSACAITIERPARRSVLALYMINLASEIIYRMLRSRGFVSDVPNFEVAMFALSLGGYIYYARKHGHFNDIVPLVLRHLIGKEELVGNEQLEAKLALKEAVLLQPPCDVDKLMRMCDVTPIAEPLIACNGSGHVYGYKAAKVNGQVTASADAKKSLFGKGARDHNGNERRLSSPVSQLLGARHCSCRHQSSCLANFLKVVLKFGSVGWAAGVGYSLFKGYRRLRIRHLVPRLLLGAPSLRTACFLGGMTGIYSLSSCLLRWFSGGQRDWHGLVAGTAGGLASAACPSSYVSLYLLWKLIELVYLKSAERHLVPKFDNAAVWLYAFCTSIMLYVAILEPHNLRPQYRKFLDDISGKLMSTINRFPLDQLGLHSSQSYPHFFPLNLDRRYISKHFLEHVLIWV